MMKLLAFSFLLMSVVACHKQSAESGRLEGTWVEKAQRRDTLVVYRSGGKDMMFDNSDAYRQFPAWASNNAFRYEFRLNGDKIGFRAPDSHGDFMWYDFRWDDSEAFTMRYNGLRPYLSSIGDITYVRLR